MTHEQAVRLLPADAKWSASFGNPGEGGYVEYHRRPDGERWQVSNGPWHLHPFELDWHCQKMESA